MDNGPLALHQPANQCHKTIYKGIDHVYTASRLLPDVI